MITTHDIEKMYDRQLPHWQLAGDNYTALDKIMVRSVAVDGCDVLIQFNPCRATSVTTRIDKCHERPCFLCDGNLPTEQLRMPLWEKYQVLVNPYPLFKHHYTIASLTHTPQRIAGRVKDMLHMVDCFAPYTIFYNGPYSGASAPMHMHFQAAEGGYMPIEKQWKGGCSHEVYHSDNHLMSVIDNLLRPVIAIEGDEIEVIEKLFELMYEALAQLSCNKDCDEPMMNVVARREENHYTMLVFPRSKHRPACYYAEDDTRCLVSPGSVEMGGVFITINERDFKSLTADTIGHIYKEVAPSHKEIYDQLSHIKHYQL